MLRNSQIYPMILLTIQNDSPHSGEVKDEGTCLELHNCPLRDGSNTALTGVRAETQEEVTMKKTVFLGALTVAGLVAASASAATLDDVKERGKLNCGVTTGLVGFAAPDANGEWTGFDVSVCRAVAAAVLGDSDAVEFVPTTGQTRFTALASGEIDMLARNTTWTFSRDTDLKFDFVGVNYYDWMARLYVSKLVQQQS